MFCLNLSDIAVCMCAGRDTCLYCEQHILLGWNSLCSSNGETFASSKDSQATLVY